MQNVHIKNIEQYYAAGGNWYDIITLNNDSIIVISDDEIGVYKNRDLFDKMEYDNEIREGYDVVRMDAILKDNDEQE